MPKKKEVDLDRTLSASEGQNRDVAMLPTTLQPKENALGDVERRNDDDIVSKVSGRKSEALPDAEICSRCKCMLERKGRYMVRWSRLQQGMGVSWHLEGKKGRQQNEVGVSGVSKHLELSG